MDIGTRLFNFVGFQVGWFACVLGAAYAVPWAGPLVVAGLLLANLAAGYERSELLRLAALSAVLGFSLDTLFIVTGLLSFASSLGDLPLSPPWLVAMWVNFALTLRSSLSWLLGRYALGALLGALGGPLAYLAGSKLGALSFQRGELPALLLLGAVWAAAVPLLSFAAARRVGPS